MSGPPKRCCMVGRFLPTWIIHDTTGMRSPTSGGGTNNGSLKALYDLQKRVVARRLAPSPRPMRLASALQIVAAILGPVTLGPLPSGMFLVASGIAVAYDVVLAAIGVVIIVLALHAITSRSTFGAYAAGLLSFIMFRFYFVGTLLGLVSLLILVLGGTTGPAPRARKFPREPR